ncbi:hypothetical protein OK074_5166 [Actinobacteria bacterium OK074]|nr:hypothetical protein OK074_5166 [Actinobacteria bacterium OK074]
MEGTDPVNKKLAVALSGGAVLALALSGCGGDDTNDKLNSWAKTVCDGVKPQAQKIEAATDAISSQTSQDKEPEQVQQADSQAFQDISDAYKAMSAAVDNAGVPDVDNGATKQKNAVKELSDLSTSYAALKKTTDALDTKDQAKFADGLKDIGAKLDELSKSGSDALKELEEGDVGQAMAQQASCKSTSSSTPTSPSGTASSTTG